MAITPVSASDPVAPLENLFNAGYTQIDTLVSNRAIQTYKWANQAARLAQTGMTEGDIGDQQDTDVTYRYSGAAWQAVGGSRVGGRVVRANTVVTIPATTWTPLATSADWTATGSKPANGGFAAFNGTWVVPFNGYYRLEVQAAFDTTANIFLAVKKNNTSSTSAGAVLLGTAAGTSFLTAANISGTVKLATGDVLRAYVFGSVSLSWNQTTDFSFFGIEYIEAY